MSLMTLLNVAVAAERMSFFNSILQDLKEHRCAEIVSHAIQLKQSKSSEGEAREWSDYGRERRFLVAVPK